MSDFRKITLLVENQYRYIRLITNISHCYVKIFINAAVIVGIMSSLGIIIMRLITLSLKSAL